MIVYIGNTLDHPLNRTLIDRERGVCWKIYHQMTVIVEEKAQLHVAYETVQNQAPKVLH